MAVGSPFTRLCQQVAALRSPGRADLHVHSTHSDGLFTPAEVVDRACQVGLTGVALTDHDTLSGYPEARAAAGARLEVIPGVEISCEFGDRELHLLGYFVRADDPALNAALANVRRQRVERFAEMARRLQALGASIPEAELDERIGVGATLGRRHLAHLLVASGHARTVNEAFARHLTRPEVAAVPKLRLPVAEAIRLVRQAGGFASWAHPPEDVTPGQLADLRKAGLQAVECEYPWARPAHGRRLRELAGHCGLAVTGGSDCHGPAPASRAVGCRGVTREELERLRALAGAPERAVGSREG